MADPKATARALDCADARESLHAFCGLIEIPGAPVGEEPEDAADWRFAPVETPQALHHKALLDLCERLERGERRRAMVFMPPGSAKSTYASVVFPAWFMGRRKRRNVILGTYASELARKMGRRMRSVIRQPTYAEVFGVELDPESRAADEFSLTNGNEFMGGGLLSGITGNRADGFVLDDPIKNRQDADSETIRERTHQEFEDTVRTRLKPGGWVLMILTRWHEDDLAGRILPDGWNGESGVFKCKDGLEWEVLCIPAEAEPGDPLGRKPGEMLWAEWFGRDPDFWIAARRNQRTWSALYQQRPAPADGTYFQREWFRRYRLGDEPRHLKAYVTSDHAPTDGEDSDPNVARVWGLDTHKNVWLLDGFNAVQTMDKTGQRIIDLIKRHKPFAWFPEDDNNWKAAAPFIKMMMRAQGAFTRIEPIKPHGQDKAARAQSAQGMASLGMVYIPQGPEGDAVIEELVKFPAGAHDEEVDCLALMCRAIDMAHPALVPPEDEPEKPARGITDMTFNEAIETFMQPQRDRV